MALSLPNILTGDIELTEKGMANLFVKHLSDEVMYIEGIGYHQWDGTRWAKTTNNWYEVVDKFAEKLLIDHKAIIEADGVNEWTEIAKKTINKLRNRQGRDNVLGLIKSHPALRKPIEEIDSHPMLFNLSNGTYDFKTNTFSKHSQDDLLTKMSKFTYNPDAACPIFTQFMSDILPNEDNRKWLQKFLGLAMTGDQSYEKFAELYGPEAANGKSTLIDTLTLLFGSGEYHHAANNKLFMGNGDDNDNAPSPSIAGLQGARFVTVPECPDRRRFNSTLLNSVVSGDRVRARFLRQNPINFQAQCKVCFYTNHLLEANSFDEALYRRKGTIPFEVSFSTTTADVQAGTHKQAVNKTELIASMVKENAGIFNWLVEGYNLVKQEGLQPTDNMQQTIAEQKDANDYFQVFLDDTYPIADPSRSDVFIPFNELYSTFRMWCGSTRYHLMSETMAGRTLKKKGFLKKTIKRGNKSIVCYYGISRTTRPHITFNEVIGSSPKNASENESPFFIDMDNDDPSTFS